MKKIVLHGALAEKYGDEWVLAVNNPAEAIRAIEANRPGFIQHIYESGHAGVGYRVIVGDRDIELEDLSAPFGTETLHLVPVMEGDKNGLGGIILGAALIAFAVFTGGAGVGLVAAMQAGASASVIAGSIAYSVGISLVLGGIAQMLVGTPKQPTAEETAAVENKPSYYFNGPVSTLREGGAVPVGYGELIVGGTPISSGLKTDRVPVE